MTDHELAAGLAQAAGKIALEIRRSDLLRGVELGAAGDTLANQFILAGLAAHRPDDAILSEESVDTRARLSKRRVWIIDPLDGTREYTEGRTDWAVHVALVEDGVPVAGAVALPEQGLLLRTDAPPSPAPPRDPLRLVLSRTRPSSEAAEVAEQIGAELVPMGSAGAKAAAVLTGEADIYLHCGGQHEWDNCAPVAVALAAGLSATALDGTEIIYNQPEPLTPDLLICSPALAARVQASLRSVRRGAAGRHRPS